MGSASGSGAMTWSLNVSVCQELGRTRKVVSIRIGLWVLAATLCLIGIGGMDWGAQPANAAECANESLRDAQAATFLPDCRAFELVSPSEGTPHLQGGESFHRGARAATAGGGIGWFSFYPLSGSLGGESYSISTRKSDGWATEPVGPRLSPTTSAFPECRPTMLFSADLSKTLLTDGFASPGSEQHAVYQCPGNNPALVPGEPEGFQNVLVRDSASGLYSLANITPTGVTPGDAWFQGASDDFSHVVFEDGAKLIESAPVGASLYEWASGAVSLVTVLPNGTPTVGVSPNAFRGGAFPGTAQITHPVSANGTRVVFETEGKLFLRENVEQKQESARGLEGKCLESEKACTVQLDVSEVGGSGGGGSFLAANASDTRIFFTDNANAKLTADTNAGSGQHLYEYDTHTSQLNDLTPEGDLGLNGLSGISDDGSYLYVVAQAALIAGANAGSPNLYVFHEGIPQLIATLSASQEDARDWTLNELTARVSSNGRYIGFNSTERLTGYDNTPARGLDCEIGGFTAPCLEIFLYDATQKELHCVSCSPGGARPTAPAELPRIEASSDSWGQGYLERNVVDDGRVFFDTANPLLVGAGNDVSNVYEYVGGHLSLISSGTSEANSFFYDASSSGSDIFFATTQHLVQGDTGDGMRLYDARVEGGFSEPEVPAPCGGEGCRASEGGVVALPPLQTTGLQDSGNLPLPEHTVAATRRQKFERALHACQRRKSKRKRVVCMRRARRRYGARASGAMSGVGK